ncbi:4fd98761-21d0-47e1-8e41-9f4fe46f5cd1 [Thermothielavioides terrestris]|uniref:Caspase-like protein n=2 Tax=Thermothielavioides terrestris TaxID=2587410 RepID=G2RCM6_THETT|nr:caspase-like protein [Thermothielavioides terrestris NRRL 8126]AEO69817.1 caspase-like protein [Thermothielavioides terrestris NRRL 8126]SPQ17615.1 4fd98761-21d0-47e1-8e41-9f4fe46f5cd1 [Thermothielavioides terrestris]
MSYGYPGQGYGPGGGGGSGYHHPPSPQYAGGGGYGQYPPPNQGYGQYPPPQQQQYHQQPGYGHYPPPQHHHQHQQQYHPPPGPPPQGYDAYGYPIAHGPGYGGSAPARTAPPPPSGVQHFGHGAPEGYTFQYSNCTGRRRALLIGINYFGQQGELRGCINDVTNVSNFLMERYGYKREDMVILTDDQRDPVLQPTKANMIRAMQWLVAGAQPNDALFLHYSGHGGQTKDLDGDEEDGYDEVIYPVDFRTAGHIVDDEIHHYVVRPLLPGVRLTAIFDSCHSGSVLDLPYIYSTKGVLKEPNLAKEAGLGLLEAVGAYARGDMGTVASTVFGLAKSALRGNDAYERSKRTKTSPADVVMWSGSKDDQTSADATIAAKATGAMSWAFITALKQNPHQSYVQLLNSIRDVLETKYTQKPQLSCSHPLDTDLLFVM